MKKPFIKICGMKDAQNIVAVSKLKPQMMGFIFYEKSKRYVGKNFLMPEIDFSIQKVGVFVNESEQTIELLAKKYALNYLQLHGDESVEFCKSLYNKNYKIIKAIQTSKDYDFSKLNNYEDFVEYFLFDTHSPQYGGTGIGFDWEILNQYTLRKKFLLSGGIGQIEMLKFIDWAKKNKVSQNVIALDLNSKFEIEPGFKNIDLLKSSIQLFTEKYDQNYGN